MLRVMLATIPVVILLAWPVATYCRHRAYGSGGGRRAPASFEGDDWSVFADLPPLGHDADMTPGPRLGDGWQAAAPYGARVG
jgi:hypothetical protein